MHSRTQRLKAIVHDHRRVLICIAGHEAVYLCQSYMEDLPPLFVKRSVADALASSHQFAVKCVCVCMRGCDVSLASCRDN